MNLRQLWRLHGQDRHEALTGALGASLIHTAPPDQNARQRASEATYLTADVEPFPTPECLAAIWVGK